MHKQNLIEWKIIPYYPYVPLLGKSVETGAALRGMLDPIAIQVPHSIYSALEREGIIPDPMVEMNSLAAEWVKDRWWLYENEFIPESSGDCDLVFEGVDYRCYVYVNNVFLGEHEGSLTKFRFSLNGLLHSGEKNRIRVLVRGAEEEMGQIGYTHKISALRPRFDYKWDFCTRLVNIGIYRPCYLEYYHNARIEALRFRTDDYSERRAAVKVKLFAERSCRGKLVYRLSDGEREIYSVSANVALVKGANAFEQVIYGPGCELWQPNGEGEARTYRLQVSFETDGERTTAEQTVGFCKIALEQNPGAPQGALPYTFCVNGKNVYVKGFNITPIEMRLGEETFERYEYIVRSAKEANANLIRVWGGGVIESEEFYELCSRYGIMVWQDLIQSSSGISNEPPVREEYLDLLKQTVVRLIDSRSSYPCLAVVTGGNELFGEDGAPITFEHKNIRAIVETLRAEDCKTAFIPSTSTGPVQDASLSDCTLNHDIHGPWLYGKDGEYYDHYNRLKCLFAGEFGCNGTASFEQIERIFPHRELRVETVDSNEGWRFHGEWWDTCGQIRELFGCVDDLQEYCALGQFLQANGLFYAISSHRRGAPYQSGCIVWQLNEMYPNVFSTSVLEYYGNKKDAYYAIRDAYAEILLSFEYGKLAYSSGEQIDVKTFITAPPGEYEVTCVLEQDGRVLSKQEQKVAHAGNTSPLNQFHFVAAAKSNYKIRLSTAVNGIEYAGQAVFFVKDENGFCDKNKIIHWKK